MAEKKKSSGRRQSSMGKSKPRARSKKKPTLVENIEATGKYLKEKAKQKDLKNRAAKLKEENRKIRARRSKQVPGGPREKIRKMAPELEGEALPPIEEQQKYAPKFPKLPKFGKKKGKK